jgi:hypothetical protein
VSQLTFSYDPAQLGSVHNNTTIEPGFAITAHKAQGQTMKVIVDVASCSGTEQPYVMVSRSTSMDGLMILRDFDFGKITKRHSEDLQKELSRLECLRLQTILRAGSDNEKHEAKKLITTLWSKNNSKERSVAEDGRGKRAKRTRSTKDNQPGRGPCRLPALSLILFSILNEADYCRPSGRPNCWVL